MLPFGVNAQKFIFTPQWTAQSQFAGYYAAQKLGYYRDAGLDVTIEHPCNSSNSIERLKNGRCNIISIEAIQALMEIDKGTKLINLLQTSQHSTLLIIARDKNVKSFNDLKGKRVGTWKLGFVEIPHMVDKTENLGIEWIKFITPINLFITGAIDATLAKSYNEGIQIRMAGRVDCNTINLRSLGYDNPEDGIYVTADFYNKYPTQCKAFAEASKKGWEWVRNNREKALEIVMEYVNNDNIATNRHIQKWMLEEILKAQVDKPGQKPSYKLNKEQLQNLCNTLLKHGYIKKPITYESITRQP